MVQLAYDKLEAAIIFGELKPRQRLVERQLQDELKISRTPIREALRRLEAAGLVINKPNHGAIVTDLDPTEIEDNYVVRLGLQDLAVSVMRPYTAKELSSLERMQADMKLAYAARDFRRWMKINTRFHEVLMTPVDNPTLLAELARVIAKTYVVWRFHALGFWSDPNGPSNSLREHEQLIDAIRNEDWKKFRQLLAEHTMRPVRGYFARVQIEGESDKCTGQKLERLTQMLNKRNDRLPALTASETVKARVRRAY
jgi:DNA-binding GntR family transcriptional regulator